MPLISSSPQWDEYVALMRSRSASAWRRYHLRTALLRSPHAIPSTVKAIDTWLGVPDDTPDEVVAIRTRDGRETGKPFVHGQLSSSGWDFDLHDNALLMDELYPWVVIADDWDTLSAWDIPWPDDDESRAIQHMLTPDLISCQNTVVVLTEQLADAIWAPPRMDTSDITAWLRLLRLPDTVASRRVLASHAAVFHVWPQLYVADPTASWASRSSFERATHHIVRYIRQRALRQQSAALEAAGIAQRVFVDWPQSRMTIRGRDVLPIGSRIRVDGNDLPECRVLSAVCRDDVVDYTVDHPDLDASPEMATVAVHVGLDDRHRSMNNAGFAADAISRPVPLDISLPAHADPRRHTVQPCR